MSDPDEARTPLPDWEAAAAELEVDDSLFRLEFEGDHRHSFPATLIRGAVGNVLRHRSCPSRGRRCCPPASGCPYCDLFGSRRGEEDGTWTKGQSALPHPVAIISEPEDWARGQLRMVLTGEATKHLPALVSALCTAGARGAGNRGLHWIVIDRRPAGTGRSRRPDAGTLGSRINWQLERLRGCESLSIIAESPLRLKHAGRCVQEPALRDLVTAAARRFAALARHHGGGQPCPPPPPAVLESCERVRVLQREWRWIDRRRYSARQARTHVLGGALGRLQVELPPPEALWTLLAAVSLGLGKATAFGFGRIRLEAGD